MALSGKMEVISSKGCSKMYSDVACTLGTNSFRDLQPPRNSTSNSPFFGLVICVTGLSKEAKKQVMDATERLGGQFSPHFHSRCTHLVVQIYNYHELKSEYALKHQGKDGLFIVTLGWFVDSVRKNVRLNESLYCVKSFGENYMAKDDPKRISGCHPAAMMENIKQTNLLPRSRLHISEEQKRRGSLFSGQNVYVDRHISSDLRNKVLEALLEEGAKIATQWLVGDYTTHVVCEGSSVQKYIGHSSTLVTPHWTLKTAKETRSQSLVHLSADMARHVGTMIAHGIIKKVSDTTGVSQDEQNDSIKSSHKENQIIAVQAKNGVRNRRGLQTPPIKPLARNILLDSINWIMSEPSSTASISMDSFSLDDANQSSTEPEACFVNFLRPLSQTEKTEFVFGNHFITILFPLDRFAEMGPASRTFFSDTGFTCSQLLHHIYAFYQENMTRSEIELAIHTDSRHADRLRSIYSSKEAAEHGLVEVKRIDFLGSRKIFGMLKRVSGNNVDNVYELLTRA